METYLQMLSKMMAEETGVPSTDRSAFWLQKAGKNTTYFESSEITGKWCIVLNEEEVDSAWEKIKKACDEDLFVLTKVSTKLQQESGNASTYVICVYTNNWQDTQDLDAVRKSLFDLGFKAPLKYKRDVETRNRIYGTDDEFYIVESD